MPDWSQDSYTQALTFAAQAHLGQKIPGSELPYVIHVSMVCMEVIAALSQEAMQNPNLAVQCALLHDTLEDTQTSFETLAQTFGLAVAKGVRALSKNHALPKSEQMMDSLGRIQLEPREVWLVKLADRINNLHQPPGYWSKEKIAHYRQEARLILQELGPASPYLAKRLSEKIQAYSAFE